LRSSGAPTGETIVTFSSDMPTANYRVAFMITSDIDWGGSSGWGYIFVSSKTASGFTLHLNDDDGGAKNAPAGVTVDWIALPSN
jgi:hypothetical protein